MSAINRAALADLIESKIKTQSFPKTSAADVRDVLNACIESLLAIIDDKNEIGGYLGIDADGRVDISKINSDLNGTHKVLQGDGTWRNSASGRATFDGNGVTTKFSINHGASFSPSVVNATAGSADAALAFYVNNLGQTFFDITFLVAPISGSGNVIIHFNIS